MNKNQKYLLLFSLLLTLMLFSTLSALAIEVNTDWFLELKNKIEKKDAEKLLQETEVRLYDAKDLQRNDLTTRFLKELAFIHIYKTKDLESAMELLMDALKLDEGSKDKNNLIYTYFGIALIFEEVDDYFNSAQFLEQAIRLNREE
ncbi:hypothetical protein C9994_13535 [Marivirga lumbricoides]|uniref:Uncharacterized protein n=1 Tax=Marivirga lumbricoides TaxID=1046115 RepID=A0A2T4DGJ6_9BACT|nr:hypothetical protein C9994_13535 [Marivirga lumbricoides]